MKTNEDKVLCKRLAEFDQFRCEVKEILEKLVHSKHGQKLITETQDAIHDGMKSSELVPYTLCVLAKVGLNSLMLELYEGMLPRENANEEQANESQDRV